MSERDGRGRWLKNCAPGPGRRPGFRARLNEMVTRMLAEDFEQHGRQVIAAVRATKPEAYLDACVKLLPKQTQTEAFSQLGHLTDAELDEIEQYLAASRARLVKQLERIEASVGTSTLVHQSPVVDAGPSDDAGQDAPPIADPESPSGQ